MQFADVAIAALGAFVLAWAADALTGKRGLFAMLLVSSAGALAGWFLAIRVFAVSTPDQWLWVWWSLGTSALCLLVYFLFRNKR